jgi:cytochrome c oxidase assembly protein subunit 15
MRVLARVLLALLVLVMATSAWVRLAQSGLSCAGAPECYATKAARSAADQSTGVAVARTLHRMSASAAGAVIVAMAFLGWGGASRRERAAIVALAVAAAGLATLGQYTPSTVPAVTLANLLGGMAMVALAAWLVAAVERRHASSGAAALRGWTWAALALVALQVAAGGMISAQHASFACEGLPLCNGRAWPPGDVSGAFDPLRGLTPPATAAERASDARQALVLAHRWLALPALLLLAWLGMRATRAGTSGPGKALVALVAVQLALGVAMALMGPPLVLAVAHNLVAVGVVIALAVLLERGDRAPGGHPA